MTKITKSTAPITGGTSGQVLTSNGAGQLATFQNLPSGGPTTVRRTTDNTGNYATYTLDPILQFTTTGTSKGVWFRLVIYLTTSASGTWNCQLNALGGTGATFNFVDGIAYAATPLSFVTVTATATPMFSVALGTAATAYTIVLEGTFVDGSTASTFGLMWENVAGVGTAVVKAGSYIQYGATTT